SPFGFAISVFTQALDRFHRYETEARVGILNRNRSTNKASPRLPFGGVKKSGNFRPAGAWAGRNLSFVMAEIHNGAGVFDRHAQIVPHLPSADLDRLEAQHEKEEQEEAARTLIERPRPMGVRLPKGGELPTSSAWLARYYAGDRYVAGEKKPPVFDHLRSVGPWLVSIDDEPMSVLDGMSQTATSPFGFAPDAVVRAYMDGEMGEAVLANTDTTEADDPYVRAYADVLRERVPTLPHVSFANSGAEANEKAYALCRLNAPETAKKLLAFEGSFHGRTLLALYASHNPQKRLRFEIPGYEVDYAPAPAMAHGVADEPSEPAGWIDVWAKADGAAARERWGSSEDALLAREVSALAEVAEMLRAGEHFAVAVEPMQSEGGDRYLSSRFHRALRSLTRARGVSLIVDEVQCGHGLGGEFLWHQRFGYVDANGAPDAPDCVCFAKRAQLGVCLSRFEDPEPTSTFAASLVRGRLHAANIDARDAHALEARVAPHLAELEKRWGHRIENLRAHGYAIAFELASPDELNAYLGQRFWRGAIVFGAGTRTVRYRLSTSFGEREVATLFDTIHRSLAWLDAHPNKKPPAWEDPERVAKPAEPKVTIRVARADEADALLPSMLALEERVYEPARRDTEETLRKGFGPDGVAVVAEVTPEGEAPRLVGMALAAPADAFLDVRGVGDDPHRADSLYSISITVDREHAGRGLGRSLKRAQLMAAQRMTREDGSPRYRHACGRNRVPDADAMGHINDAFGAYTVETIEGEYGGDGVARYYRLPLGPFRPLPRADRGGTGSRVALDLDLAGGLARPLRNVPLSLRTLYEAGGLFGPAVTKITLLNYLTAAAVRATEWVAALTPTLPHAFLCSSRDETVDKSIRMLKWHRPKGAVVIGFEGAYVGHTSAGARSLSDPRTHAAGRPYFDWPRVPHPAEGVDASIAGLRDAIAAAGGPDAVLGVYASIVGERTGRVIPDAFWDAWRALKKETGIPLVLVETPSAYYRSGRGAFAMSGTDIEPDAMIWWTGGQLGFVHVTTPYNVTAPLTLVSTWDGDELSLIQMHHQLRAARSIDVAAASEVLERALTGVPQKGLGLYRVIEDPDARIAARLTSSNIRVRRFANGCVAVVPPLDDVDEVARRLRAAL
ncbi:MAG: aminotransferase class III-fold pyridoxal phosphate-dependent enzyme, partial [Sandaracinaceae bacterium]